RGLPVARRLSDAALVMAKRGHAALGEFLGEIAVGPASLGPRAMQEKDRAVPAPRTRQKQRTRQRYDAVLEGDVARENGRRGRGAALEVEPAVHGAFDELAIERVARDHAVEDRRRRVAREYEMHLSRVDAHIVERNARHLERVGIE